ncbi:hypothetical protein [Paenibacillus sp. HGF5]|uniref:hypothetical protein n=1 Tax=Paenibacillus sp. HGF5 TaxID=908341 RepID=UPI0002072D9B|nr:hypothetical protein [Paenibacillus sp. HGF5]EGG34593.1 hypothetical protein HMPREF9412_5885 [Paenibacillus sp. HGF5]
MTSHVQDFDLKEAPQSGAYASNAYSKYIYGLCFAENFKKPPLPGGMLLYK